MIDTAVSDVRIIFDVLSKHGVEVVVCSPGSRNAALLVAADVRENLHKLIVVDERAAAFIALGIAQVSRKPVALACTSGTALLNYAPAVAEAFYQGLPLIVISADRPMEWIDQDDSQTIRQPGVYSNYIKGTFDINTLTTGSDHQWFVNRIINEGINTAISGKPGPVHFNVRLEALRDALINRNYHEETRKVTLIDSYSSLSEDTVRKLAHEIRNKKVLIVAGFLPPDEKLKEALGKLITLPNVVLLAESLSNLGTLGLEYAKAEDFRMIDIRLCRIPKDRKKKFQPDLVISIGGALVSRMLKEFLRATPQLAHWSIGESPMFADCFKAMSLKIEADPAIVLSQIATHISELEKDKISTENENPDFRSRWENLLKISEDESALYIRKAPWSDLKAYNILLNALPANTRLFLSNGTSVRYAQIIPYSAPLASYCNRGVSGIDGSFSTAIGGALMYEGTTVLITGDMSLAYDIAAFGTRLAPSNMRVIVISNSGGGIFRFISATSSLPQREKYFCADPAVPIKGLAAAYDWEYFEADSEDSLHTALRKFFLPSDKPSILEVHTPPEESARILKEFLSPL